MKAHEIVSESWSEKYKRSIDCSRPKGFSQRAHCQGRKKKVKEDIPVNLVFNSIELSESSISTYAKHYYSAHQIEQSHVKFTSNVKLLGKNKLAESKENSEIKSFIDAINQLDTVKKIKIGDKFSVLAFEIRFAWREIDAMGFIESKTVSDINLNDNGTINYVMFTDGDRYPRHVQATYNNKLVIHTAYFNNSQEAKKALTFLVLNVPDNWGLDISEIKDADGVNETKDSSTLQDDLIYIIYINNQPVVRHTSKEDVERDVAVVLKKYPTTKIEIRTKSKNSVEEDNNGLSPTTKMFLEKEQILSTLNRKQHTTEALNSDNRLPDIPTTTTYILYKNVGNEWNPVARYPTEEQARDAGREMAQELGGKYRVKQVEYPTTKYE
jgi:hypothetical protein